MHEAVSVAEPIVPRDHRVQDGKEYLPILVVAEYLVSRIPTGCDMVNGSGVFYAKGAGHAETIAKKEENVKIKYLTLCYGFLPMT